MKRHSAPKLSVDKLPPEWERMPAQLILNLEDPIREFLAALERTSEYDYEVEDFINEILIYVRSSFVDIESLDELVEITGQHFPKDAHVLQPAVARLGKSLLRELHLCGAYTSDGLLHYEVTRWLNGFTPVLTKCRYASRPATPL
jgi:hypothetical protein